MIFDSREHGLKGWKGKDKGTWFVWGIFSIVYPIFNWLRYDFNNTILPQNRLLSDIPEWSFGNSISDKETRLWFMDISRTQLNDCLDYRPPRQCSAREVACERPIVRMLCSGNATVSWWINEQARNDINGFPLPRRLVMIVLPPPRLQPKIHVNRPPGDSIIVSYYA